MALCPIAEGGALMRIKQQRASSYPEVRMFLSLRWLATKKPHKPTLGQKVTIKRSAQFRVLHRFLLRGHGSVEG